MIKGIMQVWDNYEGVFAVIAVIAFIVGFLGMAFGLWCLQAWLVMLLWNWVVVSLFGAPVLTFWLSFGLVWLFHLLTKGLAKITINS